MGQLFKSPFQTASLSRKVNRFLIHANQCNIIFIKEEGCLLRHGPLIGLIQYFWMNVCTVKILKFGTPQTIAIIVLKIE